MMECMECDKMFETFKEVRTHHIETGHFSTMMGHCECPMKPECTHKIIHEDKGEYCNYRPSTPKAKTEVE